MSKHSTKKYATVNGNEAAQEKAKEEVMIKETIGSKIGKAIDTGLGKAKGIATSKPAKIIGGVALGIGAVAAGIAIANHTKDDDDSYDLSDDEYSIETDVDVDTDCDATEADDTTAESEAE